jgi:agmatine deiminase
VGAARPLLDGLALPREAWGGAGLDEARRAYAEVAQAIARFEPVTMICRPDHLAQASLLCGPGIAVLPMQHDDSWTRDTGPTFLVDAQGDLAGVTWRFNGWGEAYPDHGQDAQMARRVLEHLGARRFASSMVMEGGGLHVDGEGTALVCAPSVLDPKRNPGMTRTRPRRAQGLLGVETVVGSPRAWPTTRPAATSTTSPASPARASSWPSPPTTRRTRTGRPRREPGRAPRRHGRARAQIEVVPIQQPRARARAGADRGRASLSYINFYLANGGLVVPSFEDPGRRGGREGDRRRLPRPQAGPGRGARDRARAAAASTASRSSSRRRLEGLRGRGRRFRKRSGPRLGR